MVFLFRCVPLSITPSPPIKHKLLVCAKAFGVNWRNYRGDPPEQKYSQKAVDGGSAPKRIRGQQLDGAERDSWQIRS